ncbi:DUF2812 domain-containing protein [Fournierella sp.]|uniref:DUF2812 domain-containing protein n=1 Tax=Allofournierella sp. TaxID=1940256 RepID=UPI0025C6933C|nr:DUF2812 domain-containing protein [Fournierella sp.]
MKRVYRISLPAWAIAEREEYYAQMAARGLLVRRCGTFLTRFERGEPSQRIYRLDAAPQRSTEPPEEQRRLYEEGGWQFVCKSDWFNLYAAAPGTTELHTDPEWQSETLTPVRRSLRNDVIAKALYAVFWVAMLFAGRLAFGRDMTIGDAVCLAFVQLGWILPMLLLFVLAMVASVAAAFVHFSHYLRCLRAGRRPESRQLRRSILLRRAESAVMVLLTAVLIVAFLSLLPRSAPLGSAPGDERLLRLEQLEPEVRPFAGTGLGGIEGGGVDFCASPFSSFQLDCTQLSGPDGSSPSLFQHYIKLRVPVSAQTAARAMAKSSFLYDAVSVEADKLPAGLDFALMNSRYEGVVEFCAVRGRCILMVQYIGDSTSAEDALALAARVLAE